MMEASRNRLRHIFTGRQAVSFDRISLLMLEEQSSIRTREQGWGTRWAQVWLATGAMVGTLPGRTQGLGLVTEPLLKSLHLDRDVYAQLNLWATLIGALFAIGIGRVVDRAGSRLVLTALIFVLGV